MTSNPDELMGLDEAAAWMKVDADGLRRRRAPGDPGASGDWVLRERPPPRHQCGFCVRLILRRRLRTLSALISDETEEEAGPNLCAPPGFSRGAGVILFENTFT